MSSNRPLSYRVGAGAHRGKVRQENQDRISRFRCPFGEVFIVADGMGGHEGGAMAAQMLVHGMETHLQSPPPQTPVEEALRTAATYTNAEIFREASSGNPQTEKMGATCVLVLLNGRQAVVAHAGDSRAYVLRRGELVPMTRDHTVVQRMLDHNMLTEDEARHHPEANVITRAFGQKPEIELDISAPIGLEPGDRLLLCSDGLSGYVGDDAIQRVMMAESDAQALTDRLIELALQAGGEDNVSVQVIALDDSAALAAVRPAAARAPQPRSSIPTWMPILALVLIAAGAGAAWRSGWLFRDRGQKAADAADATDKGAQNQGTQQTGEDTGQEPIQTSGDADERTELTDDNTPDQTPEPEETPSPSEESIQPLIVLGGRGVASKLRQLEDDYDIKEATPPPKPPGDRSSGFEEGYIYFRLGHKDQATEVLSTLRQQGETLYRLRPWPRDLDETHFHDAPIVIGPRPNNTAATPPLVRRTGKGNQNAAQAPTAGGGAPDKPTAGGGEKPADDGRKPVEPAKPEPVATPDTPQDSGKQSGDHDKGASGREDNETRESPPPPRQAPAEQPRLRVMRREKDNPETVPDRIQKNHRANWNSPIPITSRKLRVLTPGRVYYRGEEAFQQEAREIAGELTYVPEKWPESIEGELVDFDIIVVLKPAEPEGNEKKKNRSHR